MELPQDLTLDELRRFVRVNDRVIRDTKVKDKLKDKIKKVLGPVLPIGKPVIFDDVEVKLSHQNRFNAEAFAKAHPADRFPELYSLQLNEEAIPETMKRARFYTPVLVLNASMVEIAEVVMSDISQEPAGMPVDAEAVPA